MSKHRPQNPAPLAPPTPAAAPAREEAPPVLEAKTPEAALAPTGPSPAAEESKDYALYLTAFALIASEAGIASLYAGGVASERRAAILAQAASDARVHQIRPRTKFAEALANLLK